MTFKLYDNVKIKKTNENKIIFDQEVISGTQLLYMSDGTSYSSDQVIKLPEQNETITSSNIIEEKVNPKVEIIKEEEINFILNSFRNNMKSDMVRLTSGNLDFIRDLEIFDDFKNKTKKNPLSFIKRFFYNKFF